MKKTSVKVRASGGGEFDCFLVAPQDGRPGPAVVLASAIHGPDADLLAIADAFAAAGHIAAVPDLFWRTHPGPLARGDERAPARAQPRLEKIRTGEQDMRDVLAHLRTLPSFNGRAAVAGFCYGGPYAILGPACLGYAAGVAFHGSQMLDYLAEAEGLARPVCLLWGDQDHLAPAPVRDAWLALASRRKNVEVHVLAGVRHGYMMRGSDAFDAAAHGFSMQRALAMLESLRTAG